MPTAQGVTASIIHLEHASVSKHKQTESRQLSTDCKGNSRAGLPAHAGQEAFPDVHGEVGTHTRTTTTSMPGTQCPAKEGLKAEVQAQRSHTLLQGHELCSSASMSPLPYTATSLCHILKGRWQRAAFPWKWGWLLSAAGRILGTRLQPHTSCADQHCPSDNFSPKGLGIETPKQGHTCGWVCQHHSRQEEQGWAPSQCL